MSTQNGPSLQRFSATGRPMRDPKDTNRDFGISGLLSSESWGRGAPNLLPVRFTDDSIISIPVLAPGATNAAGSNVDDTSSTTGLLNEHKHRKLSIFSRNKSDKASDPDFVMKDVTRGEYLKHYAKDDNGKYIGTENPAADCILRNAEDRTKFRAPPQYSSSILGSEKESR